MPTRLMIPGPVTVDEDVLYQMGAPVQAHYGAEFAAIYLETAAMLKAVFSTSGDVHILVGSGSAGVDAGIGSMTRPGEKIIVGCNGFFGQRLLSICEYYGLEIVSVEAEYGTPLRVDDFKDALTQHPDAAALAICHMESSTAVLNPVQEIMAAATDHDMPTIVDAVSTIGGVPLEMDAWQIDICIGASQKCLGAPPGLAPVAVSQRAWEIMAQKPGRSHGWYLNLQVWQQFAQDWHEWHPFPITMATNTLLALREGLRQLMADGLETRLARYQALADHLRGGLQALGLNLFAADALSPVLTAVESPVPSSEIVQHLYQHHDIKIAGGVGADLKERVFRIGHMGTTVSEQDMDDVINGIKAYLQRK